jgi:squalene-hopene/tetraprenyl-beta-curcumene cyclase
MLEKTPDGKTLNDMPYAKGSRQGGFIYSTSENKDKVGSGETKAGGAGGPAMIEETLDDGTKVSRLRAYGSMTYAGFKSLIYAQIPASDPRITEALRWIRENYTLKENPGIGANGVYYYFLSFSRALRAAGMTTIDAAPPARETHDWRHDLIDRLAALQEPDGSFKVLDNRWMESNKVLITAYALLALQHARQ